MMLATDLAVLDHADGSVLLVANAVNYDATDERVDEAWADAVARLDAMTERPRRPGAEHRRRVDRESATGPRRGDAATSARTTFEAMVERAKEDDPRRRGVPGRPLAAVLDRLPGRRARRLPGPARRPTPAPTCTSCACPHRRRHGLRRRRARSPEALVKVDRPAAP